MPEYTTIEMMEAREQTPSVRTFLQRTFFPESHTRIAERITVDVRKGKRIMAPFVSPRIGGKVIKRQGFRTNEFTTPKIAPERALTIDDVNKRGIGENIYSRKTPEQREDEQLAKDYTDLEESIARRREWMCRQVLFDGKIDVKDEEEGVDVEVDFGFTNTFVLTADQNWAVKTVNPMPLIKRIRRQIIKECGVGPDIMIFSPDMIDDFMSNPFVLEEVNKLNLKNIVLEPRIVDPALTFYGRIQESGVDIYTYDEWFVDDDGTEKSIIPNGCVLMGHSTGEGSVEYGAVTQMENGHFRTYEEQIVPKIYTDDKNDIKMLRLTSRPLPCPYDVASWAVIRAMRGEG